MLTSPEESEHRRLHHELEQKITAINREQISAVTGTISKTAFTNVARMVARLRARYPHRVLQLGDGPTDASLPVEDALDLKNLRVAYTEAMDGYAALEHAVRRGYVSLSE